MEYRWTRLCLLRYYFKRVYVNNNPFYGDVLDQELARHINVYNHAQAYFENDVRGQNPLEIFDICITFIEKLIADKSVKYKGNVSINDVEQLIA